MKKRFHLRMVLALLGAIVVHLILWPIYCCAGSPIRNTMKLSRIDEKLMDVDVAVENVVNSQEISTNKNIAHVFHGNDDQTSERNASVLDRNTIDDEDFIYNKNEHNNNPRITSSIYDIFLINSSQRKEKLTPRTLARNDRSASQNYLSGRNLSNNKKLNGTKRVKTNNSISGRLKASTLDRNERSANLSHITGSARKIQLYIKNRFLQLLPDGTVNGTTDDLSDYSELHIQYFFLSLHMMNVIQLQPKKKLVFACRQACKNFNNAYIKCS